MAQHQITIPIDRSAYCFSAYPNTTFKDSTLHINPEKVSAVGWTNIVPARKRIINTKLHVYVYEDNSSYGYTEASYSIDQFDEDNFTWNNSRYLGRTYNTNLTLGWNVIDLLDRAEYIQAVVLNAKWTQTEYSWFELYSHRASNNKPYVVVTYEDVPPGVPGSLSPKNIVRNPKSSIRFSWSYNSGGVGGNQKAFKLEYSVDNGNTWVTIQQVTSNQYWDMPANTVPAGPVMWRVKTYNEYDEESPVATATFTAGETPPNPPTPTEPSGVYKDNQSVIRFAWEYNSSTGDNQSAFTLAWSADNGVTWTEINQSTSNQYYDMPGGTLMGGNILWKVKTANEFDEYGDYCEPLSFYSIGAPQPPYIESISQGTARPVISWSSDDQQVYQLKILRRDEVKYDTGQVASMSEKSHKIKAFLEDGDYSVRIRVKNEYDMWSEWGELHFAVQTVKPDTIDLSVYSMRYGVRLTFVGIANYALIYRKASGEVDCKCIAKVLPGLTQYDDYTVAAGKTYSYFLRHVSEAETFADSSTVSLATKLHHTQIALADDPANIYVLKYNLNAPPDKKESRNRQSQQIYFEGRKYPVIEYSGFSNHDITCTFFLTEKEIESLYNMFGEGDIVLYRDNRGRKMYGSLSNITTNDTYRGRTISFIVSKVDYAEGIEV